MIRGDPSREQRPTPGGLPQGSPLSPILFTLYLVPMVRDDHTYCYTDDVTVLAYGDTEDSVQGKLTGRLGELLAWGKKNGVPFDNAKSEHIIFTAKKGPRPDILVQGVVAPHKEALRWLGVWFNQRLTFKPHAKTVAARGRPATALLNKISGKVKGLPARFAVQAVRAVVLPTILYAAEAWHGLYGTAGVNTALEVVVNDGLQPALPAWQTTRLPVLHLESGIPDVAQLTEDRKNVYARRLFRLGSTHPVVRKLHQLRAPGRKKNTLLENLAARVGGTPPPLESKK